MAGSLRGRQPTQYEANSNVQIVNEGIPGCSLAMGQEIKVLFYTLPPGPPCSPAPTHDRSHRQWQKWVDAYNPDVVVYVARGETFNTEVDNKWTNLGQSSYNQYVADRFRDAVKVLGSRRASVVLMTTPYYRDKRHVAGQRHLARGRAADPVLIRITDIIRQVAPPP